MVKPALLDHCNTTFMPILNITPLTRHLEFLFVSRDYVRDECECEQSARLNADVNIKMWLNPSIRI